jgi:hypothetical protein
VDLVRPDDLAVLLALAAHETWSKPWPRLLSLLSPEGLADSVERLRKARLCLPAAEHIPRDTLIKLLTHGVPYLFPPSFGPITVGLGAAWSDGRAIAGMGLIVPTEQEIVWPLAAPLPSATRAFDRILTARSLEPLAPWVPALALHDEACSWYFCLAECLRAGRARERAWAAHQLVTRSGKAA